MSSSAVANLRGVAVGAFTGALAVAAHGFADGMAPSGGTLALLCVVAATFGAVVARWDRSARAHVLVGVLGVGQVVGHVTLSVCGGMASAKPSPVMLAAHVTAIGCGALLVAVSERLYLALSSAVRTATRAATGPIAPGVVLIAARNDPPQQRVRLMAASISHRGPPVGALR